MKKFLFVALIFASCAPKVINIATTTTRDSLAVKTVHHRDTIRIEGEKIFVDRVIHDTVSFVQEKKIGRADITLTNKKGVLTATCECDSIKKAYDVVLKDTTRYKFKETKITHTVFKAVTNGFDKFCRWFFIVCCVLAGVYTGLKLKKVALPL